MDILGILYVAAAVIFLFGAAVFVHEWGHYIMARKRGLKVEAFAIGFGPKIFGWTKDGIEYSWRAIPAGGYVKLPQMVTSEAIEGSHENAEPIPPASPLSKILVAIAGPFMNVVFGFALATILYFVGLPVPINPAIIGYVDPNSAEGKLGISEGDRIVEVNAKAVSSWQDITFEVVTARGSVIPVMIEHESRRQTYQLEAKPSELGLKWLNLGSQDQPLVLEIRPDSPAEKAGLKVNDKFVSFGGVPVIGQRQLIKLINERPDKPTEVVVMRGEQKLTITVTPRLDVAEKVGRIGAVLTDSGKINYELQKPGPLPWDNMIDVIEKTYFTLKALVFSRQTGVKASDLSGPVGILGMLAIQVKTDWRLALNFMVLLNINLAVLNLLPIPVLDGGHILMAIIERIRRKPISVKFVEYSTTAFAVLLISFMLYVTFYDISRFQKIFKRDSLIEKTEKSAAQPAPVPAK